MEALNIAGKVLPAGIVASQVSLASSLIIFIISGCSVTSISRGSIGWIGIAGIGLSTVKVEPPVADEVVLVEDGTVGAEERVFGKTTLSVISTDMEDLALSLGVSIVTSGNLSF